MDHRRTTPIIPFPSPDHHYVVTEPPFRPYSPAFVSGERRPDLSPSIDVDRSLSDMFSYLNMNISPESYTVAVPPLLRNTLAGQIGSSVSATATATAAGGDGFGYPVMQSDPFTHRRWCQNTEALRQHYSSSSDFDFNFDFDQKSKKFQNQNQNQSQKSQNQNQNQHIYGSWSLKQFKGRIYTLAKDQNGCRILQSLFERPTIEDVEIVLYEVIDYISDLMKDQFGNYLVQKLVAVCNDDQKLHLIHSLTKIPTNIILVCMNPYGTRAVQKLLENLKDPNQVKLVMKALHRGAAALASDPNGHHVIQYCLVNFHSDFNKPILNEIANECYKIATDRSGCCVLQACVEHSRGEVRTRIVTEIMVNSLLLAEDPFGNYVLQHMIGLNIPEFTALLVRQLQGNFAALSCNKYASNVVEKCLNESGEDVSTRIILELIRSPNSALLLVDPYANFVIQCALKVAKGFAHDYLCRLISNNISSMRTNLYGKKILEKFEKKRMINFA